MGTIKVGVREFRENFATFLESDEPIAVTRHGETIGVYTPIPHRRDRDRKTPAELADLKAAADRLAAEFADIDEEEFVAEFKELRKRERAKRAASE